MPLLRRLLTHSSHRNHENPPQKVGHWSLTTQREKLVKIGAKVVRHGRYVTFQLAKVAMPRHQKHATF